MFGRELAKMLWGFFESCLLECAGLFRGAGKVANSRVLLTRSYRRWWASVSTKVKQDRIFPAAYF